MILLLSDTNLVNMNSQIHLAELTQFYLSVLFKYNTSMGQ